MNTKIRKLENFHILLWLLKDICWVTLSKSLGVFMILPTLGLAIYITYIHRQDKTELAHNLSICFWIAANSTWMIGEFYFDDSLRNPSVLFFLIGLVIILMYYIPLFLKKNNIEEKSNS